MRTPWPDPSEPGSAVDRGSVQPHPKLHRQGERVLQHVLVDGDLVFDHLDLVADLLHLIGNLLGVLTAEGNKLAVVEDLGELGRTGDRATSLDRSCNSDHTKNAGERSSQEAVRHWQFLFV